MQKAAGDESLWFHGFTSVIEHVRQDRIAQSNRFQYLSVYSVPAQLDIVTRRVSSVRLWVRCRWFARMAVPIDGQVSTAEFRDYRSRCGNVRKVVLP
jgi:hypothetical protein